MKRFAFVSTVAVFLTSVLITGLSGTMESARSNPYLPFRLVQNESLKEFSKRRKQNFDQRREKFLNYAKERSEAYERFYRERKQAFQEYKKRIADRWGERNVEVSTKTTMTSYRDNYTGRNVVDFKEGEARAEVLVEPKKTRTNPGAIIAKLRKQVQNLVTMKSIDDPVDKIQKERSTKKKTTPKETPPTRVRKPEKTFEDPVLAGQLENNDGEPVTPTNVQDFSEQVVTPRNTQTSSVEGEDGKRRIKAAVEVDLIEEHTRKRARKFVDAVRSQSSRFNMEPSVIMAVMHTESYFNPKARSSVPAYGLMQLVPSTGGKAAYKHIYDRERLLKPAYLYQPDNNIELGAGYLNLLYYDYFAGIRNKQSRLYTSIAAYNTGPGNLAKTFVNDMDVSNAVRRINQLSASEVYSRLRRSLPYKETRKYIKKVRKRQKKYRQWLGTRG